jgi:hypothetical protein
MLEFVGKSLALLLSVLTLGSSPFSSFGSSLVFSGSTLSPSALLGPLSSKLLFSSALSLFEDESGISFGLGFSCALGVSSFESSYKYKRNSQLKQLRVRRKDKVEERK